MNSKELGIKLGTKIEAGWTGVREQVKPLIVKGAIDLEINKTILKLAEKKLAEEIGKLIKKE